MSMDKVIEFLANDWEDAVIKVMENGDRYVKLFPNTTERKANPKSDVAFGTLENQLIEINEDDYDTFGKEWHFGGVNCERTAL